MDKLKNIYAKDIERTIEGVVKVNNENYIKQELEEYVVTDELLKHFYSFFNEYEKGINSTTEGMGVWIDGFYGSGKSHFLKMLSYLLENKVVDGKAAVDYFDNKIEDKELLGKIKKAGETPSDVILFDIISKAEKRSESKDTVLNVFEKVFNEKLGLSITPEVAEIERQIIKNGKYEEFKKVFNEKCNKSWEEVRNAIQFYEDEFVQTYVEVFSKSIEEARGIIDKTEKQYTLSVENFAKRVREYIESREDGYHIIFLVDELGLYIGDSTELMGELQEIIQDLGTECAGKAWVIVTSQKAIDNYVDVKGNDFSKILGRFKTKLSLSSSDVDEVIKKRVLAKKSEARETLKLIYDRDEGLIKNLLCFTQNTAYQKMYRNGDDFSDTYPFIPYQFKLLQDVFTAIRESGFSGMHISHGERNLINSFQEAAKKNCNKEIGALIPFYDFYDTIEGEIDSHIKNIIRFAKDAVEAGELEEIDVRVLKMLFLLKNIKEIPANIENLAILYVSNIADEKTLIKEEISGALKRLEKQTLIQRNNDEYKFLTHEEQEVNRAIKKVSVDPIKVTDYLKKIVFDSILNDSRILYKNKIFYISKYIDDTKYSPQEETIGVKVITNLSDKDEIKAKSLRENNYVFIKLELSGNVYENIVNCLKIYGHINNISGIVQTLQVEEIIRAKRREADNTEAIIKANIKYQLDNAEIIIAGDEQNINAKEAKARLNEALEILVKSIYTKNYYIEYNYKEIDIRNLFYKSTQEINEEVAKNQKAYDALKEYCIEQSLGSVSMTIRSILHHFSVAPFGYANEDILYLLLRLLKNEEIYLIYGNDIQDATSEETLKKILQKEYYDKTVIKIREKTPSYLIEALKLVANKAFNLFNLREDEDGMVQDFKENGLNNKLQKLKNIAVNYEQENKYQYPGKKVTYDAISEFEALLKKKDMEDFFKTIYEKQDRIIELAQKTKVVLDFFDGAQRGIFDETRKLVIIYDNNKDYADNSEELQIVTGKLISILSAEEPYSDIPELPMLRGKLRDMLGKMYEAKSGPIIQEVENTIEFIQNEIKSNCEVDKQFGSRFIESCTGSIYTLEHSNELKDIFAQQTRISQLKDDFTYALEKEKNKLKAQKNGEDKEQESVVRRKTVKTSMLMNHSYEINSKEDLEKFIEELKNKLLKELDENKNIRIV